jgi:L-threonylcarbamoyladenylate synthase
VQNNWKKAEGILKNDGVVVLPTDTIYGIVGSIFSKKSVNKIFKIKGRDNNKPLIVLISSYQDLDIFNIKIDEKKIKILEKIWPGKVSVELFHSNKKFSHIRGGNDYNGFRMIGKKNRNLFNLIKNIGPIVAPSANIQGEKLSENIKEARKYFGDKVNLYIDGGKKKLNPSTLVKFEKDNLIVLRQGGVIIK